MTKDNEGPQEPFEDDPELAEEGLTEPEPKPKRMVPNVIEGVLHGYSEVEDE